MPDLFMKLFEAQRLTFGSMNFIGSVVKPMTFFFLLISSAAIGFSACSDSSPTAPTSVPVETSVLVKTTAAGGTTLKVGAPVLESPINGDIVDESLRPVLKIRNADGLFLEVGFDYTFQVHAVLDSGVTSMVDSSTIPGGDGSTSYTVAVRLNDSASFQWRARAEKDGRFGPWSVWGLFDTPVLGTIEPPKLMDPKNGSTGTELRPVLQVANGVTSGNVETVVIRFVIATDSEFVTVVETLTQEAGNHDLSGKGIQEHRHRREDRTSVRPSSDLAYETTYYWYAQATGGTVTSERSTVFSFTTFSEGGSDGGGGDEIGLGDVKWLHHNISSWSVTSNLTRITFGSVCLDHTKKGKWPTISTGNGVVVEGNPVVLFWLDGQKYAATYEWNRPGQVCKNSITANTIGEHIKTSPGNRFKPASGERVCFAVATPHRFGPQGSARERTQFRCTNWGQAAGSR